MAQASWEKLIVAPLELPIRRIESVPSREQFILSRCDGKKVLHIGATGWPRTKQRLRDGTFVHLNITKRAARCIGLDLSLEGIAAAQEAGIANIEYGDAEHMDAAYYRAAGINLIVAGEVLEHLSNPGLFLGGCAEILRDGGELVVTAPNAFTPSRFARLLLGKEHVHKDHVAYYSLKTITELLRRYGLYVTFLGTSYSVADRSFLKPWRLVGRVLHRLVPYFGWSCIVVAQPGNPTIPLKRVLN